MMQLAMHWITVHGYGVIVVLFALGLFGLPFPNEWLLAYIGYLVFKGTLHPVSAAAAAFFGSLCGMVINYCLGRSFGTHLIQKFSRILHMSPDKIDRVHEWFRHSGRLGLVAGFFLPGVRHVTALAAGTVKMAFTEFLLFSAIGGFFWTCSFVYLGYVLEERWQQETRRIHHMLEMASLAGIIIAGAYLVGRSIRKKRAGPRA